MTATVEGSKQKTRAGEMHPVHKAMTVGSLATAILGYGWQQVDRLQQQVQTFVVETSARLARIETKVDALQAWADKR
ncbi:MAG TPA: hypothetical protein VHK68_00800 [Gemmatimonadales bacterium]|jgi:hypothetical protein|nr:hypothetical protein [Gemmatimonadales bacterium]